MKTDNTKWPQTTDYDMFVLSDKNRKINAVNLKHLKSAIQKAGEIIYPITVRPSESDPGKYEIMDGQHRYLICRALRLPV
ncbi:ParB N-terminal domain-containing protein, partial [Mitsuokella multacida]|uniref:ParB N-terminal domain-containing protein n=2 Tax=Mitsuokella TaxID=52225 RepID=UPI0026604093